MWMCLFDAVEDWLGTNACCNHITVFAATAGSIFSQLAPIGPVIAKKSRSDFHGAIFWHQTYVVDICGSRIYGLQCLAIVWQHGGGWGWMGILQLQY